MHSHQLVPTTLTPRLVNSPLTRSRGWSCWCEKPLDNFSMLQGTCAWPQFCAHTFVYTVVYVNSMVLCVLSHQLQKSSQSCGYVQQASLKNILMTSLHKINIACVFAIAYFFHSTVTIWYRYTHSLTSSSSENLHELLSPVIILERVQIAESASMSCTVSAAWNTGTLSSATGSKMERLMSKA